jgi:hypothetical protein
MAPDRRGWSPHGEGSSRVETICKREKSCNTTEFNRLLRGEALLGWCHVWTSSPLEADVGSSCPPAVVATWQFFQPPVLPLAKSFHVDVSSTTAFLHQDSIANLPTSSTAIYG